MLNMQPLVILLLVFASGLVLVASGADDGQLAAGGLINWSAYKSMFNKHYSSLTQQLIRQKLFMSKVMLVFLTAVKYRMKRSSYFLAINRYSDLSPEEEQRKLAGEVFSSDEEPMDDEEVDRIIKETVLEQRHLLKLEQSLGERKRREKRAAEGGDGGSRAAASSLPPRQRAREISLDNLVRLPNDATARQAKAKLNLKLVVPSDNPDYQPVDVASFGRAEQEAKQAGDISPAQAREIEDSTSSLTESKMSSFVQKLTASLRPQQQHSETPPPRQDRLLVDWRRSGCIAPPVDQGDCASCYAISTMSAVEWAFCMNQGRVLTPLSVQYLVSCGPQFSRETGGKYEFYGCQTGHTRQAMHFVKDYGVELEANFPYLAQDTACPVDEGTPLKYKGYLRPNVRPTVRMYPNTSNLDKALKLGPIIVSFVMVENFLSFAGGIIDSCPRDNSSRGGHAMLLVGKGLSDQNEPFLLIKNSMGQDWGEEGYFKLKRSAVEECVKEFIWPRLSFPSRKAISRRAKAHEARLGQE